MGEPLYVTLMSSLPYHGELFGARQTPLSRFQLDKRLAWLRPEHSETLRSIEDIMRWRRLELGMTDAEYLEQADRVIDELDIPLLEEVVRTRLEARTLIAALRKRRAGHPAPGPGQRWGYGRWLGVIARHWGEADFGLARVYPWVAEASRKLEEGDVLSVDRLFMNYAWEEMSRLGAGHYFDFEAVVIYVLRWDLIDRFTQYDAAGAGARIVELASECLGVHQRIFESEAA